jgi:hypothetical protein
MRTLMILFVSMLMAHPATARQEPTQTTEEPPITAARPHPQMVADYLMATEEDCKEFAELALQGDPQSIVTFLTCVD